MNGDTMTAVPPGAWPERLPEQVAGHIRSENEV